MRTAKNRLPRLKQRTALSATFMPLVQLACPARNGDPRQGNDQQKG